MDLATQLHCGLLRQEISSAKTVLGLALSHLEQAKNLAPLRPETVEQAREINFALAHTKAALRLLGTDISESDSLTEGCAPQVPLLSEPSNPAENNE
jgi:hypothetical protein